MRRRIHAINFLNFRFACFEFSGMYVYIYIYMLYFVRGVVARPACPCLCLLFGGSYTPCCVLTEHAHAHTLCYRIVRLFNKLKSLQKVQFLKRKLFELYSEVT